MARKGLIISVYEKEDDVVLSKAAQGFQDQAAPKLSELISLTNLGKKDSGKSRVFYGLSDGFSSVAVTSIGKQGCGFNKQEEVEEGRENVRTAVAKCVRQLAEEGVQDIQIDPCGDAEAAAEGAVLARYSYDELKSEKKTPPEVTCYADHADNQDNVLSSWKRGIVLAEGQNLARMLMEAPANKMTPTRFTEIAHERLGSLANVTVNIRDKAWAEEKKMGGFLSVARGSDEPLRFLEVSYKGNSAQDSPALALVGKGITFDSGGISIKPSANMDDMRADMGGAACTLSSIYTAARLGIPINVMGFMPLCENMPSAHATKPGDVVTSMSGKTIQIDNTDAEGRLILCDALTYAQTFKPGAIVDMATLTGAIMVALGASAAGAFTNSDRLWQVMHKAGTLTGDRVWRMPVFKLYGKQMTECQLADINNIGSAGRMGGACTAAAFLKEFVSHDHWMHLDIAGVMKNASEIPYLGKGMSGRPTRTLVEFMNILSKETS